MNKTYDSLKNITRNTIKLEFRHIQEYRFEEIEGLEEYKYVEKEKNEIFERLKKSLSKEEIFLVEEFESKRIQMSCLEQDYYFKQGVISGFTNLKFLEEFGEGIMDL